MANAIKLNADWIIILNEDVKDFTGYLVRNSYWGDTMELYSIVGTRYCDWELFKYMLKKHIDNIERYINNDVRKYQAFNDDDDTNIYFDIVIVKRY